MVAIKAQQADAFVRSPPVDVAAFLFHGTDPGLVSERAAAVAKKLAATGDEPGEIVRLDDTDLEADPDRLAVELGTVPMFGGRKIIRTTASRRVGAPLLKPLIEENRIIGAILVEAGNLKADDALRALFEKGPRAAAIACYSDEGRDLEALVRDILDQSGMTMTEDARRLLISRLGADRALSRAEIEKLALYCQGAKRIEIEHVEAVVGDASELAIDRIVDAAFSGNPGKAVIECERTTTSGESPHLVLSALLRHGMRLHRVRTTMDQGMPLDEALRGLHPPLFFKQRDRFVELLQTWPAARLQTAITRMNDAMRLTRGGAMDESVVTERLLLEIAHLAALGRPVRPTRQ